MVLRQLSSSLLRRDVEHVVSADKSIAVLVLQLAVYVLLGLVEGDVHVPVQARQHTFKRTERGERMTP